MNIATTFTRTRLTWQSYLMIGYFSYLLNALGPLTPFLRAELNLSYTVASFHFSAYAVGVILTGLVLNRMADRFGVHRLVWVGGVGMAAGVVLLMAGRSPVMTIGGAFIMGLMGTFLVALLNSVLASLHRQHSAIALTESSVVATMISMMAPVAVGFFARTPLSWRAAMGLMVLMLPLIWIAFRRNRIEVGQETIAIQANPNSPARDASAGLPLVYWVYWFMILLAVAIEFCMIFWAADFLENVVGMLRADAAMAVSAFLGAMLLGRAANSRLLRWVSSDRMLLFSLVFTGGGFLLFWLSQTALLAVIGLLLAGIGVAGIFPIVSALALSIIPGRMVEGSARLSLAVGMAILLLPLLLGRIADWVGIRPAYGVVAVLILLSVILSRIAPRLKI
jgi:fucose permease